MSILSYVEVLLWVAVDEVWGQSRSVGLSLSGLVPAVEIGFLGLLAAMVGQGPVAGECCRKPV